MSDEDPLKFIAALPKARQPKRSSGVNAAQEVPHTETSPRATVRRKKGQTPEVIPAKPRTPRATRTPGTATLLVQPRCPVGHAVSTVAKFCPECGKPIVPPDPTRCRNGHEITPGDKFCDSCGTPLQGEAAAELLSEDEQRAKEAAHRRAIELGNENPVTAYVPGKAPAKVRAKTVVIHFLVDGFGAFGNVWMRGQEIEVWPGHPRWREAQRWILLDVPGQYARYGRQIFGQGPWPYAQSYTAGIGHFQFLKTVSGEGVVSQPTEEELARADAAERQRGRRVPMPLG